VERGRIKVESGDELRLLLKSRGRTGRGEGRGIRGGRRRKGGKGGRRDYSFSYPIPPSPFLPSLPLSSSSSS